MNNNYFNILIVDDEPKNIKLVASFLGVVKNYKLSYTTSPEKALSMVNEQTYDLILLDINMPKIDGFEVCKIIKKNPVNKDIPIIFLTAMLDDKSMEKAFQIGAADYITKPIKKLELVSRIKTIFAFHQYQKEILVLKHKVKFSKLINQTILDVQTNPIIFFKEEKISSCNQALLLLLNYNTVDNFLEKEKSITKIIYDSDCNAMQLNDVEWIEKLFIEKDNKDRKHRVSIRFEGALKHFLVNISQIKYNEYIQYVIYFEEIPKESILFSKE